MVQYIDSVSIKNKRVLLRVDFNVTLQSNAVIADTLRIRQAIPTIKQLLRYNNSLILLTHLGRPNGYDVSLSLKPIVTELKKALGIETIALVNSVEKLPMAHTSKRIVMLENIRFFPEEQQNDPSFAKRLAAYGDVYVNDAFGVSHRADASVVGIPRYLPSYGGLLLKKEISMITAVMTNARHPVVAIIGGAKISTKIHVLARLIHIADHIIVGGGLANTFLAAQGFHIGSSLYEKDGVFMARDLLKKAQKEQTSIILPVDAMMGSTTEIKSDGRTLRVDAITQKETQAILDIGTESMALIGVVISSARTIIWNGPVGYIENPSYRKGTDFIYYSIAHNRHAISIVGGGDTLAAISKKEYLHDITHISTGGGAMLAFIEKGSLVGIEAMDEN